MDSNSNYHLEDCKCDCLIRNLNCAEQPVTESQPNTPNCTEIKQPAAESQQKTKRIDDLSENVEYRVKRFRTITTRYGLRIIADLENGNAVFLPAYVPSSAADIEKLNAATHSIYYLGRKQTLDKLREYYHVDIKKCEEGN